MQDAKAGNARPQVKRYSYPGNILHSFLLEIALRLNNSSTDDKDHPDLFLTEVLIPSDSRTRSLEIDRDKRDDIIRQLERGTFNVILLEEVPKNANILPGIIV